MNYEIHFKYFIRVYLVSLAQQEEMVCLAQEDCQEFQGHRETLERMVSKEKLDPLAQRVSRVEREKLVPLEAQDPEVKEEKLDQLDLLVTRALPG